MPHTNDRRRRHRRAYRAAAAQGGVLSRRQLYQLGIARWDIRLQIRADRWQAVGDQSVALHNGPLSELGAQWAAVIQGGPRARLDAGAALVASGLQKYDPGRLRVSVPRGARVRRTPRFDIRQTRRWRCEDVLLSGVPRTPPDAAAVHEALWARSNRQAQLVLTMTVQQGLVTPAQLGERLLLIKRDKRRHLLHEVVLELAGGVRSLNELDFVQGCRERGFPAPDANVLRRTPGGAYYLDFRWERYGVVVEIDGIQHAWVQNVVADALRHNTIALEGDIVLRLPAMGLRACPDPFYAQVADALVRGGWSPGQGVIRFGH